MGARACPVRLHYDKEGRLGARWVEMVLKEEEILVGLSGKWKGLEQEVHGVHHSNVEA